MTHAEALAKFAAATNSEIYDPVYGGGQWLVRAINTAETIEHYLVASSGWAECSKPEFGEIAGFKFITFDRMQPRRGEQRRELSVIDFGDQRVVVEYDLTPYE